MLNKLRFQPQKAQTPWVPALTLPRLGFNPESQNRRGLVVHQCGSIDKPHYAQNKRTVKPLDADLFLLTQSTNNIADELSDSTATLNV
jgi:hypothetical protein